MKNALRKTLLAGSMVGVAAFATSSAIAQSFPDFTVNEAVVPGAISNTLTADKITGNYFEVITFNGGPASGSFNVALLWNAGQFVGNDGKSLAGSQLGSVNTNQYGLYALYTGSGSFTTSGSVTTFMYSPGGSLSVFLDPSSNTTFNQPTTGASSFTASNNGEDIAIANGATVSGQGQLDPTLPTCTTSGSGPINCGNFGTSTTFNLSAAGTQYFTSPTPFYNISFQSAELNNFSPTGTRVINGSLDVTFNPTGSPVPVPVPVPEPASMALLALGLLGLGFSQRKVLKN